CVVVGGAQARRRRMVMCEAPRQAVYEVPAHVDEASLASNEYVADTLGEWARGQWLKIKSGDSGALPVLVGFIVIIVIFQSQNSKFLSSVNLVNLIQQAG